MDMMKEAKIKKLKDLKKMLQLKMLEAVAPEDVDSIVSDNVETNEEGEGYEESLSEGQGMQRREREGGQALEEGLLEEMIESMRGPKRSGSPLKTRVLPPEPAISISVSTMTKPMKKKKRRKA